MYESKGKALPGNDQYECEQERTTKHRTVVRKKKEMKEVPAKERDREKKEKKMEMLTGKKREESKMKRFRKQLEDKQKNEREKTTLSTLLNIET